MKKAVLCVLLVFISIVTIYGQNNSESNGNPKNNSGFKYYLFGGVSVPLGDYGSTDLDNGAFASAGYNVGIDVSKTILPNFSWCGTVLFSVNNFNQDGFQSALDAYSKSTYKVADAGAYNELSFLTGAQYEYPLSDKFSIYCTAKCGVVFSSSASYSYGYHNFTMINFDKSNATSFGYNFNLGVIYSKFNFSFRYFYTQPEFPVAFNFGYGYGGGSMKLSMHILLICLGYEI